MTVSDAPVVRPRRPRPQVITLLRLLLPALATVILVAVLAAAAASSLHNAATTPPATRPIELVGPRLVGADNKKRPFTITATTAVREDVTGRIRLTSPVLVRDPGGVTQMRVTAQSGVYDETAGRLQLTGDVQMASPNGAFHSPSAVYDAKTGEVLGANGVNAQASGNQLKAGSFAVKDKGKSVVYQGGVHTRLNLR